MAAVLTHMTVLAEDPKGMALFLSQVFGWTLMTQPGYDCVFVKGPSVTIVLFDQKTAGRLLPLENFNSRAPLLASVNLDNIQEMNDVIIKIKSFGGKMIREPMVSPWGDVVSFFQDPDGHLWELAVKQTKS
ncbi:MAG: VOC family protein [Proteobacteria bacterium]|nr:VOC family protein [Pseudomonadota bacterium]